MKTITLPLLLLLPPIGAAALAGEIHDAALDGNLPAVKRIVQTNPKAVSDKHETQATALHFAAMNGHTEMVDFLLKNGADILAENFQRNTPAHFAAQRGHTELVKKFVQAKPEVINAKGAGGVTMLMFAVKTNKALVEFLIANKADLEITNDFHATALSMAALKGNAETVGLLLKGGANVNARDDRGDNAAHVVLGRVTHPHKAVLEVLIAHKIDLNAKGNDGLTVLGVAKRLKDPDVVTFLQSHGAK